MSEPDDPPASFPEWHPLLERQLRQSGFVPESAAARSLLDLVGAAYHQHDRNDKLTHHATELMAEELQSSIRSLRDIIAGVDIAADGVILYDADEVVTYANQAAAAMFGASAPQSMHGRTFQDLSDSGTIAPLPDYRRTALEELARTGSWQGEITLHPPGIESGRQIVVRMRRLPYGGRVSIIRDITEAQRRDAERRRLESQLEEARKLEALGKLAGGVVHDFNNLLGAILGFAQFIVDDTENASPLHRYAQHITTAGQQAKSLIEQILAFSRHRNAEPQPIDLPAMVEETMHILHAVAGDNAHLRHDHGQSQPAIVFAARSEMTQLLTNLVINAAEALGSHPGEITIQTGERNQDLPEIQRFLFPETAFAGSSAEMDSWTDEQGWHHIAAGMLEDDLPYACLGVFDTGCGMTAEIAGKAFGPFFTTKRHSGGTGLGLAVVHGIVLRRHGGILISTKPGQGSRFRVFLPMAEDVILPNEIPSGIAAAGHQGSILLVEDNLHFSDMLSIGLERLGYQVSICDDPTQALEVVAEDPDAWDLLITDQTMDEMSGSELVARIKQAQPGLPCLICTAASAPLSEAEALRAGADGFVTKPIDLVSFSQLVKTLCEKAR